MILLLLLFASPPNPAIDPVIARLEARYNHMESLRAVFVQQYRATEQAAVRLGRLVTTLGLTMT